MQGLLDNSFEHIPGTTPGLPVKEQDRFGIARLPLLQFIFKKREFRILTPKADNRGPGNIRVVI